MAYKDTPIETAHLCARQLRAIEDLITQASEGSDSLSVVDPDHLSLLLRGILDNLDGSLEMLEQQDRKPQLRTV